MIVKRFFRLEQTFIMDFLKECLRFIVSGLMAFCDRGWSEEDFVSGAESPIIRLEGILRFLVVAARCCWKLSGFAVRPETLPVRFLMNLNREVFFLDDRSL